MHQGLNIQHSVDMVYDGLDAVCAGVALPQQVNRVRDRDQHTLKETDEIQEDILSQRPAEEIVLVKEDERILDMGDGWWSELFVEPVDDIREKADDIKHKADELQRQIDCVHEVQFEDQRATQWQGRTQEGTQCLPVMLWAACKLKNETGAQEWARKPGEESETLGRWWKEATKRCVPKETADGKSEDLTGQDEIEVDERTNAEDAVGEGKVMNAALDYRITTPVERDKKCGGKRSWDIVWPGDNRTWICSCLRTHELSATPWISTVRQLSEAIAEMTKSLRTLSTKVEERCEETRSKQRHSYRPLTCRTLQTEDGKEEGPNA
ncbi:hypothetical protein ERJ75_000293700 [Trypanosoma vivax]|nr:hypothetical protein ERJ75_000293700 [Trypanosoma vivax]